MEGQVFFEKWLEEKSRSLQEEIRDTGLRTEAVNNEFIKTEVTFPTLTVGVTDDQLEFLLSAFHTALHLSIADVDTAKQFLDFLVPTLTALQKESKEQVLKVFSQGN